MFRNRGLESPWWALRIGAGIGVKWRAIVTFPVMARGHPFSSS
jgi:hypothetical protein